MLLGKKKTRHHHDDTSTTTTRKSTKRPGIFSRWRSTSMRASRAPVQESDSTDSDSRPLDAGQDRAHHQHTTRNKDIILYTAVHNTDDIKSQGRYQCDAVDQGDMGALVWLSRLIESGQDDKHSRQHAIFATSIGRGGAQKYRHQRPGGDAGLLDLSSAVRLTDSSAQGQLGSRIAQVITHVTTLDLTGHGFDHFPEELLRLTSLRNLCLADNRIEELPAGIERLSLLERLVLRNNRLTSLPLELGHLENLRELCVCGNLIAHVPTAVGQPYRLPELRPLSFMKVSPAPNMSTWLVVSAYRQRSSSSGSRGQMQCQAGDDRRPGVRQNGHGRDLHPGKLSRPHPFSLGHCCQKRGCERKLCDVCESRASHLEGRERAPSRRPFPPL
jgi:hypothetical protein